MTAIEEQASVNGCRRFLATDGPYGLSFSITSGGQLVFGAKSDESGRGSYIPARNFRRLVRAVRAKERELNSHRLTALAYARGTPPD